MLGKLLSVMNRDEFVNVIVSLTDLNPVGRQLQKAGFRVHALDMKKGRLSLVSVAKLSRLLKLEKPDVVQTWLYHADLAGALASRLAGYRRIAWNVRTGSLNGCKRQTFWVMKLCSLLSSFVPERIIFCSQRSQELHLAAGYCRQKAMMIPNGVDLTIWKRDVDAGIRLRRALGMAENSIVLGHAARFHPQKDHASFVQAAALAHQHEPALRFILCGDEIHDQNEPLANAIRATGKADIFKLLGSRDDMPDLMNAFDFFCLSSFSESFPNVLLEAMASAVPCVTTDVGDACHLIRDSGFCVPPRNVGQLSDALVKMAQIGVSERQRLGERARDRVVNNFDILQTSNQYAALYRQLAKDDPEAQ